MINIFRKIRLQIAFDNKPGKYLRYAIGEIVLVVIGILIALGINSWNEDRKGKIEEKQIISNLHEEFSQNKLIITSIKDGVIESSNACLLLLELMNKDITEISKYNVDSLIYSSLEHSQFIPSNNTLIENLQTGNINLISNKTLKKKLFKWITAIENNKSSFLVFEKWIEDGYLPYLIKNTSLKNVDKFSPMAWKKNSEFEVDIGKLFKDREYENVIDNNLYHHFKIIEQYNRIEIMINDIIKETYPSNQ